MVMNIGVCKVLSVFGERGFGVVCLAECERPVKRRVTSHELGFVSTAATWNRSA